MACHTYLYTQTEDASVTIVFLFVGIYMGRDGCVALLGGLHVQICAPKTTSNCYIDRSLSNKSLYTWLRIIHTPTLAYYINISYTFEAGYGV